MARKVGLKGLRVEVARTDEQIMKLIARRLDLARRVGEIKLKAGLPIQDYNVEKTVLERNLRRARELELPLEIAEEVTRTLIHYAVQVQDEHHRLATHRPRRKASTVLVVGGCGAMGNWIARYFNSFGYSIAIFDQRRDVIPSEHTFVEDLERAARRCRIIVLATPISATPEVLRRIAVTRTKALVFDICSLKSPLYGAIEEALAAGIRVTSVHPMFGPGASVLAGRNIVFCQTGTKDYSRLARSLFAATTARLIDVPLRMHDRFMGYVLGLSHLVNLVFGRALALSGFHYPELQILSSTTFNAQTNVSEAVARENQDLYYEIQTANDETPEVLSGFATAFNELSSAILARDREGFRELMDSARHFFDATQ